MKSGRRNKNLEQIADSWIDGISPQKPVSVSPYFKENVLYRLNLLSESSERSSLYDKLFLRWTIAVMIILIGTNIFFIFSGRNSQTTPQTAVEQLMSEYPDYDTDTYNNYSYLAFENKNVLNDEN